MRTGGGKQKGAAFEREICKSLSLWVTRGRHEDVFWRSAMSGGRATLSARKGRTLEAQSGDLSAVRPEGAAFIEQFEVECKFYRDLNILGMLYTSRKDGLLSFWEESVARVKPPRLPFLVAKQNLIPILLVLNTQGAAKFRLLERECAIFPEHDAHLFAFELFLTKVDPQLLQLKPLIRFK